MKVFSIVLTGLLSVILLQASSQDAIPKGFAKGSITLADNSEVTGFIKDNIRNKAAVVLMPETGGRKTTYDGDKLNAVNIDGTKYICMKGDFFKVLCDGELSFLQKSSDASAKPVYVGNETMFINGTEGKPDDYFIFNTKDQQLKLVNNKNVAAVSAQAFINCEAALAKAKQSADDIAAIKEAVVIYNNRNN